MRITPLLADSEKNRSLRQIGKQEVKTEYFKKTEYMVNSRRGSLMCKLHVGDVKIKEVQKYKFLGSVIRTITVIRVCVWGCVHLVVIFIYVYINI